MSETREPSVRTAWNTPARSESIKEISAFLWRPCCWDVTFMARSTVLRHSVTAGVLQVQRRVKSWQHVASELCVCWHVRLAKNQTKALVGLLGPSFFLSCHQLILYVETFLKYWISNGTLGSIRQSRWQMLWYFSVCKGLNMKRVFLSMYSSVGVSFLCCFLEKESMKKALY